MSSQDVTQPAAPPEERPGAAKERRVREHLAVAAAMLEEALLSLRELPVAIERSTLSGRLDAALSTLTRLGRVALEQVTYLERMALAADELAQGNALLADHTDSLVVQSLATRLADVVALLTEAREEVIDVVVGRDALRAPSYQAFDFVAKPFMASMGVPALYSLAREPLDPEVDIDPLEPAALLPQDIDMDTIAAAADGEPAAALTEPDAPMPFNPPAEEGEPEQPLSADKRLNVLGRQGALLSDGDKRQLLWTARDCLSNIASFGNLREPLEDRPWLHGEPFEERLLTSLDALMALTQPAARYATREWNVLQECQRYATALPIPDRGRHFARALVLGCVDGQDTARAAVLAMRQANDVTRPGYRRGLALASSPALAEPLRRLLRDGAPRLIVEALETLRWRRELRFEDVVLLTSHPDRDVLCAAARALGVCAKSDGVVEALRLIVDEDDDELCVIEAATSLALHGRREGLATVRAQLRSSAERSIEIRQRLLELLVLCGDAADIDLLSDKVQFTPREATLVGWYGHVQMIPWLLAALQAANEVREETGPVPLPMEVSVSQALYRLTGASLRDEPFEGLIYDFDNELALTASTWEAWWQEHGGEYDPALRYRYGEPFSALQTVDELEAASAVLTRRDAALELALLAGPSRFEPGDWVARQRVVLGQLRRRIEQAANLHRPGRWPRELIERRA